MTQATPTPEQYLGRTLPGGWVVNELIGRGTFAWVFDGYGPDGERCAIKVLRLRTHQGERRFHREIKVLCELPPNPHSVGYRGHGETADGAPFYAMEYIDGVTLKSVVGRGQALPERTACELMLQLCEGFAGLHRLGLAHRDIKPENIMITREGHQVKLMDFGLVQDSQGILKLFEERELVPGSEFAENLDEGMLVGTPEYMAPEQMADSQVGDAANFATDVTSDVYSLGVIFYQLLSGQKPFPLQLESKKGPGFKREIYRYMKERIRQDDNLIPPIAHVTDEVFSIVYKALRRDPKLRQGSAMLLRADIERYLTTGEGIPDDLDVSETVAVSVDSIKGLHKILKNVEALYGEQGAPEDLEKHGKQTVPPPVGAQEAPTLMFQPTVAPPAAEAASGPPVRPSQAHAAAAGTAYDTSGAPTPRTWILWILGGAAVGAAIVGALLAAGVI